MNKFIKRTILSLMLCASSQAPLLSIDSNPEELPEAKRRKIDTGEEGSPGSQSCSESEEEGSDEDDPIASAISEAKRTGILNLPGDCSDLLIEDKDVESIKKTSHLLTHLSVEGAPIVTRENGGRECLVSIICQMNLSLENLSWKIEECCDTALQAIAGSHTLPKSLKVLFLEGKGLTSLGLQLIARKLENLTSLTLKNNEIKDEGAQAIADSETLQRTLTVLVLENNGITHVGITSPDISFIANSANLPALQELCLPGIVNDDGARRLAAGNISLTGLFARDNGITGVGLNAIATSQLGAGLQYFDLTAHSLGPDIGSLSGMRSLTHLYLRDNNLANQKTKILAQGAKVIADSGLPLEVLDLEGNNIEDAGVRYIAESMLQRSLKNLSLRCNKITSHIIPTIAQNMVYLTHLDLSLNEHIEDRAAEALAHGNLGYLKELRLELTSIKVPGLNDIVNSSNLPRLLLLDVSRNRLGDESVEILKKVNSPLFTSLEHLNFGCTGVTNKGFLAIYKQHTNLKLHWEEDSY